MSTRGKCSNVTDIACEAPANGPGTVSTTCHTCGDHVCKQCSKVQHGSRICNNCEAEHDRITAEHRTPARRRRLSRTERLQAAADAGFDTWEDFKGEK